MCFLGCPICDDTVPTVMIRAGQRLTAEGGDTLNLLLEIAAPEPVDRQRGLKFKDYTHIATVMVDGSQADSLVLALGNILQAMTDIDLPDEAKGLDWSRGTLSPQTATAQSPNDPSCAAVLFYVGFNLDGCPLDDAEDLEDLLAGRIVHAMEEFEASGVGVEMSLLSVKAAQSIIDEGCDLEPETQVFTG